MGRELSIQEKEVLALAEQTLAKLIKKFGSKCFLKKCEVEHVREMVKLCHQIRSLKGEGPLPT